MRSQRVEMLRHQTSSTLIDESLCRNAFSVKHGQNNEPEARHVCFGYGHKMNTLGRSWRVNLDTFPMVNADRESRKRRQLNVE